MKSGPDIAEVAALIGDPARSNVLVALMDGRALTASELACAAGVSPATASEHLRKLTAAGLLAVARQGRHRYYRLAGPAVAELIEAIARVAADMPWPKRLPARGDDAIRRARTCYDHLAGELGVALTEALVRRRCLEPVAEDFRVTPAGVRFLAGLGIDLAAVKRQRRAFARQCLDWTERRPHLGGALGAALLDTCFARGWVARIAGTRAVMLTPSGRRAVARLFDVRPPDGSRRN